MRSNTSLGPRRIPPTGDAHLYAPQIERVSRIHFRGAVGGDVLPVGTSRQHGSGKVGACDCTTTNGNNPMSPAWSVTDFDGRSEGDAQVCDEFIAGLRWISHSLVQEKRRIVVSYEAYPACIFYFGLCGVEPDEPGLHRRPAVAGEA